MPIGFSYEFSVTDSVSVGTDSRGITGCPEALYQLRMLLDGKYIGRVGFNLHTENGQEVVSITNMQGIPGGSEIYEKLRKQHDFGPYRETVRLVKDHFSKDNCLVRGIKNPRSGNAGFYNTVFKKSGVRRLSYKPNRK